MPDIKEDKSSATKVASGDPVVKLALMVIAGGAVALLILFAFWLGGQRDSFRDRTMMRGGMMSRSTLWSKGSLASSDRTFGVVTQVSGDIFTIAGNGAVQQVQTSGSTIYWGGDQVKVNDSVAIWGSTENNVIKADKIVINP